MFLFVITVESLKPLSNQLNSIVDLYTDEQIGHIDVYLFQSNRYKRNQFHKNTRMVYDRSTRETLIYSIPWSNYMYMKEKSRK